MKTRILIVIIFLGLFLGINNFAKAQSADCPAGSTCFVNPLQHDDVTGILKGLLTTLQGVVAIIAIIMIIIGGVIYMTAGVNEKNVELAKKVIGAAVLGLAIIVAAPAFLKELLGILGGTDDSGLLGNAPSLKLIAERLLQVLLSIVGILGIIGLLTGASFYLTSYGDEDRIKKAKSIITASLIGILVAFSALVIVKQVAVLLG